MPRTKKIIYNKNYLIDEVLLPFWRKIHFLGVLGHQGVKGGIGLTVIGSRFRTQNSAKPLSFLPSGSEVR